MRFYRTTSGFSVTEYADGTALASRMPWGTFVGARVLCPDGKVRATCRIAMTADTFCSVSCAVQVTTAHGRKTVSGILTVESRSGSSVATADDPAVVRFLPVQGRKNYPVFQSLADARWEGR